MPGVLKRQSPDNRRCAYSRLQGDQSFELRNAEPDIEKISAYSLFAQQPTLPGPGGSRSLKIVGQSDVSHFPTATCSQFMMASSSPLGFDHMSAVYISKPSGSSVTLQHKPRIQWVGVMFFLSWFLSFAAAAVVEMAPAPTEAPFVFEGESLLQDERMPVLARGVWKMMSQQEHELRRRAKAESETTTVSIPVPSTTTVSASPLPSPFDSSLASNFTGNDGNGACPAFINSFLTSPTFKQCYPISLLLQVCETFVEHKTGKQ